MKKIILHLSLLLSFLLPCNAQQNADTLFINDTCRIIDNYLTQLAKDKNFSGGLLIVKGGKKIFNKGYGWANKEQKIPFTPTTLASMGSITKAFTAAGVMKLVEQGKLSVNDVLKKFFPNVPDDKANITIHQLLTHASGFHEFLQNDGGDYAIINTEGFLKQAFSEPLSFIPGQKAIYTNVGMSILAIIMEKVTGTDYETFLKKNLFEPIGIKKISYCYPSSENDTIAIGYITGTIWGTHAEHFKAAGGGPYWNLKGNGGLEASLNDMFLWINALTYSAVLKPATVEKMFTPAIQEEGNNGQVYFGYGCNISKSRRNTKLIDNGGSNGVYFARLIRLPEEGLVIYMVTNESSINTNMVLPNITQLYFQGKITQDALTMSSNTNSRIQQLLPLAEKIYDILVKDKSKDLESALQKAKISVEDDMILLDVGNKLIQEKKQDEALILYQYYTQTFPNIVVAWNDMGDVYRMKDNKEEAINCYKRALKLRPNNPRAKKNLDELGKN